MRDIARAASGFPVLNRYTDSRTRPCRRHASTPAPPEDSALPALMLGLFALTLFVSATLLFLIEPMVGKLMLPLLGGTPAVWNTCMLFFQAVLLAGYLYAHLTTKYLGPRKQAWLHLGVLVLPLLFFAVNGPLTVNAGLIEGREGSPILALLLVLTVSIFIPMFVVCTSASVLQRWFADTDHPAARDPYFLYGASNLGSMLALVAYPLYVEPTFTLANQRLYWCFGFAILAALIALCAYMMFQANPPAAKAIPAGPTRGGAGAGSTGVTAAQEGVRKDAPTALLDERESAPVTWLRRLRWTLLSVVPSSLMLGVTTYITTDIAAIPLLWVLPLALYLLTFIIVFAVFKPMTQNIVIFALVWILALFLGFYLTPQFFKENSIIRWVIMVGSLGACLWAFQIFTLRDKELIHHVMVMVMPLLVLLLIFIMLAEISATIHAKIALHLVTLFIVSMVCHGELARDRPAPEHLTEFFLIMSVGGVIGGLFNALFAPVAFHAIIEYQLMMMVACLLVPALGFSKDNLWARRADLALAAVFFLVGGLLLYMYWGDFREKFTNPDSPKAMTWSSFPLLDWSRAAYAFIPGLLFGCLAAWQAWGTPPAEEGDRPQDHWLDRTLDVVLPLGLFVLVLGLYWGLPSKHVRGRVGGFAELLGLMGDDGHGQFRNILMFGLPAVLCYTFVERSVRFGLGVGAILLAAGMSQSIREGTLHQERSFFGVLKVEHSYSRYPEDRRYQAETYYEVHRLVHGTTLHGKQFLEPALRNLPSSYYHSTGPVGQLIRAYNHDPNRGIAVIGLGTGTVAAYGLPGQVLDYYDIDAQVIDIAFDTNEFFTYIEDAEARGTKIGVILGDARLTFDPNNPAHRRSDMRGVPRLLPLHRRTGEARPERKFGTPLSVDDKYGLIFADAFSSDAIPVHLITKEAVEIYLRRLLDDGVLCVHISNRYLDLAPVLANIVSDLRAKGVTDGKGKVIAQVPDLVAYDMSDDDETAPGKSRSHWIVISRKKENLRKLWDVPLTHTDDGQLAAIGLDCWLSQSQGLLAPSGVALACRAIAEQATLRAAEEEGRPYVKPEEMTKYNEALAKKDGKPPVRPLPISRTKWVPLETSHDMDERVAAARKELAAAEKYLTALRGQTTAAKAEHEKAKEALKKPQDEYKKMLEEEKKLEAELEALLLDNTEYKKAQDAEADLIALIKREEDARAREALQAKLKEAEARTKKVREARVAADAKLAALDRKLNEAKTQAKAAKKLYDEAAEKETELENRHEWLNSRRGAVAVWHGRLEERTSEKAIEKRLDYNRRVGVWNDDFSNIWSVFSKDDLLAAWPFSSTTTYRIGMAFAGLVLLLLLYMWGVFDKALKPR